MDYNISTSYSARNKLVETFLVCGLPTDHTPYDISEVLANGEEIVIPDSPHLDFTRYSTPIVDVQLVNVTQKESCPEGYEALKRSFSTSSSAFLKAQNSDDLMICFRRGFDKPPISDIGVFAENSLFSLKRNATCLDTTVSGRPVSLRNNRIPPHSHYLSYLRVSENFGVDQLALTDICIIFRNKGELCPLGYKQLEQKLSASLFGAEMHLCYKKSFIKQYIAAYQPEVLLCHTVTPLATPTDDIAISSHFNSLQLNHKSCMDTNPILAKTNSYDSHSALTNNLDMNKVANFCLPWGASIESWSVNQSTPKPVFFTFVLTDASYRRLHGSALTFYEPYDLAKLDLDKCYRLGVEPELVITPTNQSSSTDLFSESELNAINEKLGAFRNSRVGDRVVGTTKTLCLLSRYYFGNSFKSFLSFLHKRCLGDGEERSSIPLERYLAFLLYEIPFPDLHSPNVIVDADSLHLFLQAPCEKNAASSTAISEPFASLLLCLGTDLSLLLIIQLLTEQKLLLISVLPDLLTNIAQALISIIYPLRWVLVYIPYIHIRCVHVIQSPSPYLIGVDSRFFEFFQLPSGDGVTCIDIDTHNFQPAKDNPFPDTKCLPKSAVKKLRASLYEIEKYLNIVHKEMASDNRSETSSDAKHRTKMQKISLRIKQAFLVFMASLLRHYRRFVLPVSSSDSGVLFNPEGFIKVHADRSSRSFYRAMFGTQLWADFIRDLTYISERTGELEAFDTYIADHFTQKSNGRHLDFIEVDSQISNESGSTNSVCRLYGSHNLLPSSTNDSSPSPSGSLSTLGDLHDSLFITSNVLLHSQNTKCIPFPSDISNDTYSSNLSDHYTWTKWGKFPTTLNFGVFEELQRRIWISNEFIGGGVHKSASILPLYPPLSSSVTETPDTNNSNVVFKISLSSQDPCSIPSTHCGLVNLEPDRDEKFHPLRVFVGDPVPFPVLHGVAETVGLIRVNAMMKRTQQETADCLLNVVKCRQLGGVSWAHLLLSEGYSIWFLLLPAYISSIILNSSVIGNESSPSISSAENLLFRASQIFFRLMTFPSLIVDQVIFRILLVLLYEIGAIDAPTFKSWCQLPLNATSFALANELQRDFGQKFHKLYDSDTDFNNASSPNGQLGSPLESKSHVPLIDLKAFDPRVLSTPVSQRRIEKAFYDNSPQNLFPDASSRSPNGFLNTSMDKNGISSIKADPANFISPIRKSNNSLFREEPQISIESEDTHILNNSFGDRPRSHSQANRLTHVDSVVDRSTKKGWRSFAMKSIKSINSIAHLMKSFELTMSNEQITDSLQQTIEISNFQSHHHHAPTQHWGKPPGFRNLFSTSNSTRLPRTMRPWNDSPDSSASGLNATTYSIEHSNDSPSQKIDENYDVVVPQSSWLNEFRSGIHRHLSSFSPAVQRLKSGDLEDECNPLSPNSSQNCQEHLCDYADQMCMSPHWHDINGLLAVGKVEDRVNPANPLALLCQLHQRRRLETRKLRSSSCCSLLQKNLSNRCQDSHWSVSSAPRITPSSSSPNLSDCISPTVLPLVNLPNNFNQDKPFPLHDPTESFSDSTKPPIYPSTFGSAAHKALELRVIMTTCSTCPSCENNIYDEEIMAAWVNVGTNSLQIHCPYCTQLFVPKLTVRTLAIIDVSTIPFEEENCRVPSTNSTRSKKALSSHGLVEYSFPYVNPIILRNDLDSWPIDADFLGAVSFSSASLLGRQEILLWNLVYLFHRVGLPTHLLDRYPAWLMDCQREVQRLGSGRCVFDQLTVTKVFSEIILSPNLPVLLVAKYDAFTRKNTTQPVWTLRATPAECLKKANIMSNISIENPLSVDGEFIFDEVVRLVVDALRYGNIEAAIRAVLPLRRMPILRQCPGACLECQEGLSKPEQSEVSCPSTNHTMSLYREFFSLYFRIHKVEAIEFSKFDDQYARHFDEFLRAKEGGLFPNDGPPSFTVTACRAAFRYLSLD